MSTAQNCDTTRLF